VLADIVRHAIESRQDTATRQDVIDQEGDDREQLRKQLRLVA